MSFRDLPEQLTGAHKCINMYKEIDSYESDVGDFLEDEELVDWHYARACCYYMGNSQRGVWSREPLHEPTADPWSQLGPFKWVWTWNEGEKPIRDDF